MGKALSARCSIERCLTIVGEKWTLLIVREAFFGVTRFGDFRERLGIAPDVLADRLATLVEYDVLAREPYQEPGSRLRHAYVLTSTGRELRTVLAALQQWGDAHVPPPGGPSMLRRIVGTDRPIHVGFVNEHGREVPAAKVAIVPR